MDRTVSDLIHAQPWYVRYPRAVPLAILVAVLTIAAVSIYGIERIDADRTRSQTRAAAIDIAAALERRAISHVTYLRAGAMLLSASGRITPQTFHELAAGMADDEESRGMAGFTWAPRVAVADLAGFEAARRAEGLRDFTVHPRPTAGHDFVVPVTYVSNPGIGSSIALGFDMASEPLRRAAMAQAARDHHATATGKLMLLEHNLGMSGTGFLVYMPVYARPQRGGGLLGFVCAPFNAQSFLDLALATVPARGLGVSLFDGSAEPAHLLARLAGSRDPNFTSTRTLAVGGRRLVLVVEGQGHGALSSLSVLTLLFALLVAGLLMLLAQVVTRNAQDDRAALGWLEEQVSIRNTLTRELNHRVKNTLANVLSIIALTRRRARGLEEFAESLTGRIMALSATHDLLTGLSWEPAPLRAVVAAELAPYAEGGDHIIAIDGPEVALAPKDALSLGLAMHELATNASKYGALSVQSGQVTVSWVMITPELARIVWQEQGGPPVAQSRRRGFGTDLIEKIVAHELGHGVDLRFDPAGVRCSLMVPVRLPAVFVMRAGEMRATGKPARPVAAE